MAAFPSTNWVRTDSSLWNQFFSSRAHTIHYSHCFSHGHPSSACSLLHNTNQHFNQGQVSSHQSTFPSRQSAFQQTSSSSQLYNHPVCYSYNQSPDPVCQFPNCRYDHICYWYRFNSSITNKLYCPNQSQQGIRPLFPSSSQHAYSSQYGSHH